MVIGFTNFRKLFRLISIRGALKTILRFLAEMIRAKCVEREETMLFGERNFAFHPRSSTFTSFLKFSRFVETDELLS